MESGLEWKGKVKGVHGGYLKADVPQGQRQFAVDLPQALTFDNFLFHQQQHIGSKSIITPEL